MAADLGHKHAAAWDSGFLEVGDIHKIYYEQYGKKGGKPVIFLHGGPGGGTTPANAGFFDPEIYHVVLLDQRGSGKSTPNAEMRENTTQHLISDIETLRKHAGVDKWHVVFGGSWGSTLALAYAEAHPEVCKSLVLRGIFLGTQKEFDWTYKTGAGRSIFPEEHAAWINYLPEEDRAEPLHAYHKLLTSEDKATRVAAGIQWNRWETNLSMLIPEPDRHEKEVNDEWTLAHSRMETHYFVNDCFFTPDQLINDAHKISHIPTAIVQGRYDIVCIPATAYNLHKALKNSTLHWIPNAGHSANEPGTKKKLIEVCDEFGKKDF